jgi:enoyl-CoA hydratase/carnithine racemase
MVYPVEYTGLLVCAGVMMVQLSDAVDRLEDWQHGRVVTVAGHGHTFCSGGQLEFVHATATPRQGGQMSIFMQVRSLMHH